MRHFILLIVFFMYSCVGKAQTQNIQGTWSGKLDFGVQKLTFVVHFIPDKAGWIANADSPDQGAYGLPFKVQVKGDSIYLSNDYNIKLALRHIKQDSMLGKFEQNGMSIPIVLVKQKAEDKVHSSGLKYQTPKPPYPYDTLDVEIKNEYAKITLGGTITKPKKVGIYPAVILLTGSGAQDRDETLFGHKPFKVLADYLTKQGIVVLRYDDRGVGKSGGSFAESTIEDFSKDALSAFQFLKTQSFVDINRMGIIGHSEGGLIATLLAAQGIPHLSYIVSMAGPTIPINDLLVEQLFSIGKAEGMSELQLAMARDINVKNFNVVKSNLPSEDAYKELLRNMHITKETASNEAIRKEALMMLSPAYRYFVRINPQEFIKNIYIPVFGAYGSLDLQVPSTLNLRGYHDYLPKNSKTVLKEYQGLNHLFQLAKTGKVSEYAQIEETLNEQVMRDIAIWIKQL